MKGKYGVPMNGIEHMSKRRRCKSCVHGKPSSLKNHLFCTVFRKYKHKRTYQPCKRFMAKATNTIASECITYSMDESTEKQPIEKEREQ